MQASYPKIAISGAGPGGLTLARILQRNGIPVTIFELDANAENRDQGGSLDLHPTTGQAALHAAGLMKEFRKFARPEGDCKKLIRYDGKILWDENPQVPDENTSQTKAANGNQEAEFEESEDVIDGRPEIDRVKLRAILVDSLEPGTIQWAKKLVKIEPTVTGSKKSGYDLHFADGAVETGFDLVVGADGAWSKVRPLLTDVRPFYSGITGIELWANNVAETNPWLSEYTGNGSSFMFHKDRAVICQRNGSVGVKDSIRVLVSVRQPEDWSDACGIDWTNPAVAREELAERYFGDCHPDIKKVIKETGDALWVRKLYMLPVGLDWPGKKGLTLVGDAAHLMTPFAGVGVNVAMTDAKVLGENIVSWWKTRAGNMEGDEGLEAAVRDYEKEMLVRAKGNAEQTMQGLEAHFAEHGGEQFVNKLKRYEEMRRKAREEQK